MKRRDFLCGASCLLAGFALGNITKKNKNENLYNKKDFFERDIGLGDLELLLLHIAI